MSNVIHGTILASPQIISLGNLKTQIDDIYYDSNNPKRKRSINPSSNDYCVV